MGTQKPARSRHHAPSWGSRLSGFSYEKMLRKGSVVWVICSSVWLQNMTLQRASELSLKCTSQRMVMPGHAGSLARGRKTPPRVPGCLNLLISSRLPWGVICLDTRMGGGKWGPGGKEMDPPVWNSKSCRWHSRWRCIFQSKPPEKGMRGRGYSNWARGTHAHMCPCTHTHVHRYSHQQRPQGIWKIPGFQNVNVCLLSGGLSARPQRSHFAGSRRWRTHGLHRSRLASSADSGLSGWECLSPQRLSTWKHSSSLTAAYKGLFTQLTEEWAFKNEDLFCLCHNFMKSLITAKYFIRKGNS